jgi:hypothetical protein
MKLRILILMTVLLQAAFTTLAQPRYKLKMYTRIWCPYKAYRNLCSGNSMRIIAEFNNGASMSVAKQVLDDGSLGMDLRYIESTCETIPWEYNDSISFNVSSGIYRIYLRSKTDESDRRGCHNSCETTKYWYVDLSQGTFYSEHPTPADCYGSNSRVWIYPERIGLTASETYLPSADRITIAATAGYPAAVYKWEYNVGGGDADWRQFPASTNTAGRSTIEISGYDLMGAAFDNIPRDKNVFIRVRPADYCESDRLTLKPTIPAPHITGLTPVVNKCFGEYNGTIKVQFDRPLHNGETLNILLTDTITGQPGYTASGLTALDAANSYTFPEQFGPGGFKIELIGTYNDVRTYTGHPAHREETGFTGPTAVNFTTSSRNVYCHGGADATITINASGGVGNYRAAWKKIQDAIYNEVGFSAAGQHTISGLDSGVYQVRVLDGNNCVMKNNSGNEVIQTITIIQPSDPVQVDYKQATHPTAFGYTDGSAMAIIIGGTPVGGNSYDAVWKDGTSGSTLITVTNSTGPFTTKLQNVGNGTYIITATDANYALTSGTNAAGCMVSDTIRLHEPPLLKVAIELNHYVSCKSSNDGLLYAKAEGGIEIPGQRYGYQWYRNNNGAWTSIGQTDSIAKALTAGTYKATVTDKNNITRESEPFLLTEPDLLTLNLTSTPVICSGGNNGTATATINGGTLPYVIEWSNGEKTPAVTGLQTGTYMAFVTDGHGCQTQQQIKVTTPNPILINNQVIQQPVCTGSCNGVISYMVSGGTAPYRYQWNNGSTAQNLTGLCAGTYTVFITDAQGCSIQQSFTLQDPLPLTIELGPDRTLCTGQSWVANAAIPDAKAVYTWSGVNGFSANTAAVSLIEPGKYKVQVTDSKGCNASDSITISRSNATVSAEFVSATQAFKGDKVTFVNISQPWPETIEWLLPSAGPVTVVRRTDSLVELQFNETGTYRIGMRSGVGTCTKEHNNSITIVEGQSFDNPGSAATDPFVLEFMVAPNPGTGQFTVTVGLRDVADINLRLINLQTGATINQQRKSGSKNYTVPYNINVVSGVYALVLETAKDSRVQRVLIL